MHAATMPPAMALAVLAFLAASATVAGAFDCVQKLCSKMESCAEAVHHLTVCGEGARDADNDGIPCENVCGKTLDEMRGRLGPAAPLGLIAPQTKAEGSPAPAAPPPTGGDGAPSLAAPPSFTCSGKRKCGEMASCEEARFYLSTCGVRSLDRDGDGVPCESLCGSR